MTPTEPRDPLAQGYLWATRVTALGLEFALPPLAGHLVDRRLGTAPAGTLIGSVLGFTAGMVHLLRLSRTGGRR